MPTDFIERVRALDKAATEGPWSGGMGTRGLPSDGPAYVEVRGRYAMIAELPLDAQGGEDAEFIAAARSMLPAAVEALARVRELHTPKNVYPMKDGTWIRHCRGCQTVATFTEWPCETYQATEVEA